MKYKCRQSVLRKTLDGEWTEFEFLNVARFYFVKNYTEDDILVSFLEDTPEENCFLIKTNIGEEVSISSKAVDTLEVYTNKVYVKGTGDVEVEQLDSYVKLIDNN